MSNVQTKYSTTPSKNTKLGSLSLEENKTRFRDINDLFRQLMADVRQESDEARSLISTASSKASTAQAAIDGIRGEVNETNAIMGTWQSQITEAKQTAEDAENAAEAAATSASTAASQAATAAANLTSLNSTVTSLQSEAASLANRVTTLESAASEGSGVALVDGTTIEYQNGNMTAVDVAVDGDLTDLASGRGQIGRTAAAGGVNVNELVLDGWYAVGGTGTANLPEGVVAGVMRVSSGYAAGTAFQTFFSVGDTPRVFIRDFDGTNFSAWREPIFSNAVGNGLAFENGVITADLSTVLPVAGEDDYGRCLSGGGTWKDVATPDDLVAVNEALDSFAESLSGLRTALEAVQATVAAEPDGTTIVVVDGQYSVPLYLGATAEDDGIAGLVPPAEAGADGLFLRSDGTWADPGLETSDFDGATSGLVPAPEEIELEEDEEDRRFLKHDGTWEDPCEELEERVTALEEVNVSSYGDRISDLEQGENPDSVLAIFNEPAEEPETPEEPEGGE